ncbi:hypothetical protein N656DRAFT_73708 [Canariomyces notabilis]|uniref:RING-type domain-containing protein n=1 Tax=Canariomyces notabilis TaxID=2074819 RepID=A0AAN6YSE7_9PEZI|nr:hypothetical protein N656DRAFT_73708 [Canariomyces arenarius]
MDVNGTAHCGLEAVVTPPSSPSSSRVSSPVPGPSPQAEPARPEVSVWKDIRNYYLRHGSQTRTESRSPLPLARCPICLENELDIQGLAPSCSSTSSEHNCEAAQVLICGHMVGAECLKAWWHTLLRRQEGQGQGKQLSCPVCRHGLHFRGCNHVIPSYRAPRSSPFHVAIDSPQPNAPPEGVVNGPADPAPYVEDVQAGLELDSLPLNRLARACPLTLLEGGIQPHLCNQCRLERAHRLAVMCEDEFHEVIMRKFRDMGIDLMEEAAHMVGVGKLIRERIVANIRREINAEQPSWGGASHCWGIGSGWRGRGEYA